jgi:hypothetical protein
MRDFLFYRRTYTRWRDMRYILHKMSLATWMLRVTELMNQYWRCLDARFRKISSFIDLKIFSKFSEIKQWTKEKQKVIVRQIISIITSLMIEKWSHAMNFTRALIDFILIAQYRSHDGMVVPVGRMFAPGQSREEGSFPEEQVWCILAASLRRIQRQHNTPSYS